MDVRISSPKHYESMYRSSDIVRAYLDQIEENIGKTFILESIDILRISLLIAQPAELAQGKFLEYEKFDWRCKYIAVGVNGDFEQYHSGDDLRKISILSEMILDALLRVSKKRKSKFDYSAAKEIIDQITRDFTDKAANC